MLNDLTSYISIYYIKKVPPFYDFTEEPFWPPHIFNILAKTLLNRKNKNPANR